MLKLHDLGSDRMPAMLFVISEGCLKAITIVMYSGNATVIRPINRRPIPIRISAQRA